MPTAPGNATILVVEIVEDTTALDTKGQPQTSTIVTEVTGCKLAPARPTETRSGQTDSSSIGWAIATPPHPAAIGIKPDALIWYDDGGQLAGKTLRATYNDPVRGVRDVAQFTVTGALVLTDLGNAVDHVTIDAKSEVG